MNSKKALEIIKKAEAKANPIKNHWSYFIEMSIEDHHFVLAKHKEMPEYTNYAHALMRIAFSN